MNKFGILGFPLSHSFSKKYFEKKFVDEQIFDAKFETYEIAAIEDIGRVINDQALKGFCITIPHKKAIIPFLTESTDAVKEMGACNCVQIRAGKLFGHNTDIIGFEKSFTPHLKPTHTKALVLGTGGAAAAVIYVLNKLSIAYKSVSRRKQADNLTYQELDEAILAQYQIIINCTPLGTSPNIEACPAIPYQYLNESHYLFDLIYNPEQTKFLSLGKEAGATIQNGYPMLTIQAEENWRIWNAP